MLHSIGFAPATALGGVFLETPWEDVATTVHASAFSLKSLAVAALPLMTSGGSIVGLDFDARQAWPAYDWMGVAKAALESTCRYLARDLGQQGIRVNLVAAGPIRTMAAKSIPGFGDLENAWTDRAPLGWDTSDPTPVARAAVALLSDLFPATSGSMVMVDGGFHALGFSANEIKQPDAYAADMAVTGSGQHVSWTGYPGGPGPGGPERRRPTAGRPGDRAPAPVASALRGREHPDRSGHRGPATLPDRNGQRTQHIVDGGHLVAGDRRGVLTAGDGEQGVQRDRGGQQRRGRRRRAGRAADRLVEHHPADLLPGGVRAAGDVQGGQRPGGPARRRRRASRGPRPARGPDGDSCTDRPATARPRAPERCRRPAARPMRPHRAPRRSSSPPSGRPRMSPG